MHAIRDRVTGKRLNAFGGRTIVRDRVWLGLDVMILAGAEIGDDCVIGARSVVTGRLPSNAVCVGVSPHGLFGKASCGRGPTIPERQDSSLPTSS